MIFLFSLLLLLNPDIWIYLPTKTTTEPTDPGPVHDSGTTLKIWILIPLCNANDHTWIYMKHLLLANFYSGPTICDFLNIILKTKSWDLDLVVAGCHVCCSHDPSGDSTSYSRK